jgi:hypothetical protein
MAGCTGPRVMVIGCIVFMAPDTVDHLLVAGQPGNDLPAALSMAISAYSGIMVGRSAVTLLALVAVLGMHKFLIRPAVF